MNAAVVVLTQTALRATVELAEAGKLSVEGLTRVIAPLDTALL